MLSPALPFSKRVIFTVAQEGPWSQIGNPPQKSWGGGHAMEEEAYRPGLEGVVAAETSISFLDLQAEEIVIRGYNLIQLAQTVTYPEVVYLLLEGRLPSAEELSSFLDRWATYVVVPQAVYEILRRLGPAHPMDALRTAISALGAMDPRADDRSPEGLRDTAMRLLAQVPMVVAASAYLRLGKEPVDPKPQLGPSANFLAMITGRAPTPLEATTFDRLLTLYSEHEMPNSTFAARVIASTLADVYGALTGAVASLKGTLHGGANEAVMRMLLDMGSPDRVEPELMARLSRHERIMGFGHRVYMHRPDPRAVLMKELLKELVAQKGHAELLTMCEIGEEVMHREKGLYPNLDYYAAPVYYLLDIPVELDTPIFFAARLAGLLAHIEEQYRTNRLFRPRVRYTGPRGLTVGGARP
jgi:citrate synthase